MQKDLLWRCLNVVMLGISFLIAFSGLFVNISMTTVLTGQLVGKVKSTVPVGVHMASGAISLGIGYFLIPLFGLRAVYIAAGLMGAVGSALMIVGADQRIFGLLIVGTMLQGPSIGAAQTFRFTSAAFFPAPEFSQAWRTRAISFTVGCAFFAAGIGPEATRVVKDDLDQPFTGAYILLMGLYCALTLLTGLVDFKMLAQIQANQQKTRSSAETDGSHPGNSSVPEDHDIPPQTVFKGPEEGGASKLTNQLPHSNELHLGRGTNSDHPMSKAPESFLVDMHLHNQPRAMPLSLVQFNKSQLVQQQQQQQPHLLQQQEVQAPKGHQSPGIALVSLGASTLARTLSRHQQRHKRMVSADSDVQRTPTSSDRSVHETRASSDRNVQKASTSSDRSVWKALTSADRDMSLSGRSDDALNVPPPLDDPKAGGSVSLCRGMCRVSGHMRE